VAAVVINAGDALPPTARWSPDGGWLLFGTGTRLFEMRIDGSGQRSLGRGWDADWRG
jgi:hypothetical protein